MASAAKAKKSDRADRNTRMMQNPAHPGEILREDALPALKIATTESALISRTKLKRLSDKLGLDDIATLLFYHRREAATNEIERFGENMAAINFIGWMNNQIKAGSLPIEGRTNRKLGAFFADELEPIISKDEVRTCLEMLGLLPLEEGCLLANWWAENEPKAEEVIDIDEGTTKPRKILKDIKNERDTTEGLMLVRAIIKQYDVKYLDILPAVEAWGKIVSREFNHSLIKDISEAKTFITLNDGSKLYKTGFCDKYRNRFKAESV
jgi:hypothetical protein